MIDEIQQASIQRSIEYLRKKTTEYKKKEDRFSFWVAIGSMLTAFALYIALINNL